jgi:outer membrane protein insertion porin family
LFRTRLPYVVAGLLCAAVAVGADQTDAEVVDRVVIEGTKRWHPDRVRFLLTTRPGKQLDQQALTDDIHAIELMGPFSQARCELVHGEDGKLTVVFRVTELPTVSGVTFVNLGYFQRSGLEKFVQTKAGSSLNPLILESDRRAIERHFQDDGYRYVTVTCSYPPDQDSVRVAFVVNLGREIKVGRVVYVGLPPGAFARQLDQALLNGPGQPYHAELMYVDRQAVQQAVQDLGWLDARLRGSTCEYVDYVRPQEERSQHGPRLVSDGSYNDRVVLAYELEPGARYHLGGVSFVGNTVATQEAMRRAFGLADGVPFANEEIRKAIERSRRLISNQGYARARCVPDHRLDLERHLVYLTLHVEEGSKYRIGRVDLSGNHQTNDATIRRALELKPGDWWNDDALDESRRQLIGTGLFDTGPSGRPALIPRFPEDRPGEADLMVEVDESSSAAVNFSIAYSSGYGVIGEVSFREGNFDLFGLATGQGWRGAGQQLGANAFWSQTRFGSGLSWTNPHLMDGPYYLSLGFNYADSTRYEWDDVRYRTDVGFGRSFLGNRLGLGLTYAYTDLKVSNVQTDACNDALFGAGRYYLNTTGLSQRYDHLDNPRFPTSGFALSAGESITGQPFSATNRYWDYSLRGDGFLPLFAGEQGGVTYFHLAAHWLQRRPFGDDTVVPFYQRFRGGGPSGHRGFAAGDLGPRELNANGALAWAGGTTDALASGEFSVPVQDDNRGIHLVVFCDTGNVWGAEQPIRGGDLRTAVGFGIRFPAQFPIALDFAWLLDAQLGEAPSQIQFTLAQFQF